MSKNKKKWSSFEKEQDFTNNWRDFLKEESQVDESFSNLVGGLKDKLTGNDPKKDWDTMPAGVIAMLMRGFTNLGFGDKTNELMKEFEEMLQAQEFQIREQEEVGDHPEAYTYGKKLQFKPVDGGEIDTALRLAATTQLPKLKQMLVLLTKAGFTGASVTEYFNKLNAAFKSGQLQQQGQQQGQQQRQDSEQGEGAGPDILVPGDWPEEPLDIPYNVIKKTHQQLQRDSDPDAEWDENSFNRLFQAMAQLNKNSNLSFTGIPQLASENIDLEDYAATAQEINNQKGGQVTQQFAYNLMAALLLHLKAPTDKRGAVLHKGGDTDFDPKMLAQTFADLEPKPKADKAEKQPMANKIQIDPIKLRNVLPRGFSNDKLTIILAALAKSQEVAPGDPELVFPGPAPEQAPAGAFQESVNVEAAITAAAARKITAQEVSTVLQAILKVYGDKIEPTLFTRWVAPQDTVQQPEEEKEQTPTEFHVVPAQLTQLKSDHARGDGVLRRAYGVAAKENGFEDNIKQFDEDLRDFVNFMGTLKLRTLKRYFDGVSRFWEDDYEEWIDNLSKHMKTLKRDKELATDFLKAWWGADGIGQKIANDGVSNVGEYDEQAKWLAQHHGFDKEEFQTKTGHDPDSRAETGNNPDATALQEATMKNMVTQSLGLEGSPGAQSLIRAFEDKLKTDEEAPSGAWRILKALEATARNSPAMRYIKALWDNVSRRGTQAKSAGSGDAKKPTNEPQQPPPSPFSKEQPPPSPFLRESTIKRWQQIAGIKKRV